MTIFLKIINDQSLCFTANLHTCRLLVKTFIGGKLQIDFGEIESISIELIFSEVMEFGKEAIGGDFEKFSDFHSVVRHIIVVREVVIYSIRSPRQFFQYLLYKCKTFYRSPHSFKSCLLDLSYNRIVNLNKLL
jgi:hypothetical protein